MSSAECVSCGKPKAVLSCEVCNEALCKKCDQILQTDTFSFLEKIPDDLSHLHYCGNCYDTIVAPALDKYNEVMDRAKNSFVFFLTQRKETPLIKKAREVLKVSNCVDRDETILRLAFLAAQAGYNAIINVEVAAEKVRYGAYQTSRWFGSGVAADIDGKKLELQEQRNAVYR